MSIVSNRSVEVCRKQWLRGLDEGNADLIAQPTRNHISRTRLKLNLFQIDVNAIIATGYALLPLEATYRSRRSPSLLAERKGGAKE